MESKLINLVICACFLTISSFVSATSNTYKLRSVYRANLNNDCTLVKVEVDKNNKPASYSVRGHCCQDKKYTDFEITKYSTSRGLEATFQWSHDTSYYLTAHSTGSPFTVERLSSGVTDSQRFIITSFNSGVCPFCIRLQSASTRKYLASSDSGEIRTETNPKLHFTIFQLHRCPLGIQVLCPFLNVSCSK